VYGLCAAGGPLFVGGCAAERAAYADVGSASSRLPAATATAAPEARVTQAGFPSDAASAPVPVDLDAVFRLAEGQNTQIALAREKLHDSQLEGEIAAKGWLPRVTAGAGYYRHEGGIQNEDGTLTRSSFGALFPGVDLHAEFDVREATFHRVDAERKRWQQQGELAKVNNETLLESANSYSDLLAARRGESVAKELQGYQRDILKRAEALAKEAGPILVESVRTELSITEQGQAKLHQQGDAAAAKLAYLLGLDPSAELVPLDDGLSPIDLVDATPPTPALVGRALSDGPGVKELEGLLGVIQSGLAQIDSPLRFAPTVSLCVTEGAFGAGPDSSLDWDNRLDVGLTARWNLTEWATAREKKCQALSKQRQVELSLQDLRGKLTLGVKEAREAILSGREQIKSGAEAIKHASETYRLSKLRLQQNAPGASTTEVMQAIRGLQQAHLQYVTAVAAYNKAQIRLLLLLGPGEGACKAAG
jgi:outer membrane protein TolC